MSLLASGSPCWARYISLNIKPKGEVVERFVSVSAVIANEGDEPAHRVQAFFEIEGHTVSVPPIAEIRPHEQETIKASVPVGALEAGAYTGVLRVTYADGNGYALSTVAVIPVSKRVNPPSPVAVVVRAGDVTSSGEVDVQVSNVVRRSAPVHVRLITPGELTVTPSDARVVLLGGQQESLRFAVRNASALPGSSYAVFAIVDTEENGARTSVVQSDRMAILASADAPSSSFLIAALALIPIVVLLFVRVSRWAAMRIRKAPPRRAMPGRVSG
jgi:hypothetical protein